MAYKSETFNRNNKVLWKCLKFFQFINHFYVVHVWNEAKNKNAKNHIYLKND